MTQPYLSKYSAEFVLDFGSEDRFVFRASDSYHLDRFVDPDLLERVEKCHIYLVCKRPHISLIPDSIRVEPDAVRFQVNFKLDGSQHCAAMEIPRKLFRPDEIVFEASPPPHRELISRNNSGEIVMKTLLVNFVHLMPTIDARASDLEVVYVGKGLSARKRLMKHETLQQILAQIHSNEPDSEIFALLYRFRYRKNLLSLVGTQAEISGDLARLHNEKALKYKPSEEIKISLVEASLIAHFRPVFNSHYLDFPNRRQTILRGVYEADIAAILVQLDNTNIGDQRIYAKGIASSSIHNVVVDFRRLEGKPSFFDAKLAT